MTPTADRRVLLATAAASTVCVFPAFLVGAMAIQIRAELGFSDLGTGLAVGAFFAAASAGSTPLGRWAERLGPGRGMRLAALWSGAAQLGIAVGAHSLGTLVALLMLAGAANALGQPASNLLIARALPAGRQGLGFAVKQSAIPFATMLAGLAVPTVALTAGWRWAFAGAAGLSVLSTAAVPRSTRYPERVLAEGETARAPLPIMVVLSAGMALGAAAAGTLGAFLVSSAVETGLSPGAAGLTLTWGSAIGIAARLLAGVRADRRQGGHLRVVVAMLAIGSVGYALFAVGEPAVFLAAVPLAFGAGWAWPGLFNLAVVRANPGSPAAATGITQTGIYLGVVAGPLGFGVLAEQVSFGFAWLMAAAATCASAAIIWMGRAMLLRSRLAVAPLPPIPAT